MFGFWKSRLTDVLINSIKADDGVLIHLATEEFQRLVDWQRVKREVRVVQPMFLVRKGDLLQGLSQQFDFAVANILAPVICMLAAPLKKHLHPGGRFLCSGIIQEAEHEVSSALLDAGYVIDEVQHKGDWVAFACHC